MSFPRLLSLAAAICVLPLSQTPAAPATLTPDNWPCFRGHDRLGIAAPGNERVPLEWSDERNIAWKTALPGRGASSPIVWGESVYVTAYSGFEAEDNYPPDAAAKLVRHLLCVDRRTGKVRWKADLPSTKVFEYGLAKFGRLHGFASSTPVADESGVYVFLGRGGVAAFEHTGKERWRVHFPAPREHNWGSASSPILHENLLIVHADVEVGALVAYDKQSGSEAWRAKTGAGDSWSTPLVVTTPAGPELVFHHSDFYNSEARTPKVAAVDPRTGAELWEASILKEYHCPSPVARDGIIYWLAHLKAAAVRAGGRGDVTASHVAWTGTRGTEVCTPIVHDAHLYWTNEQSGIAYCADAKTGEIAYQERLEPNPGRIYASGVLVADRIYYVTRKGGIFVVEAKPQFRLLAHNRIASDTSQFNGTPAISRGQMFLRSDRFLYCIGRN